MNDDGFTPEEAQLLLDEWAALLERVHEALIAQRYVEADAWVERVAGSMQEQDVFGELASGEIIAVEDAVKGGRAE